ncbi:hypothetical protein D3C86_1332170 [compost metagenome]
MGSAIDLDGFTGTIRVDLIGNDRRITEGHVAFYCWRTLRPVDEHVALNVQGTYGSVATEGRFFEDVDVAVDTPRIFECALHPGIAFDVTFIVECCF